MVSSDPSSVDPRIALIRSVVDALTDRRLHCPNCNMQSAFKWESAAHGRMCCTLCSTKPGPNRLGPMLGLWNVRQQFPCARRGHSQQSLFLKIAQMLDILLSLPRSSGSDLPEMKIDDPRIDARTITDQRLTCYQPYVPAQTSYATSGAVTPVDLDLERSPSKAMDNSLISSAYLDAAQDADIDPAHYEMQPDDVPSYQRRLSCAPSSSTAPNSANTTGQPVTITDTHLVTLVTSITGIAEQAAVDRQLFSNAFQSLSAKVDAIESRLGSTDASFSSSSSIRRSPGASVMLRRPHSGSSNCVGAAHTQDRLAELNAILNNYDENYRQTVRDALLLSPKFRMFSPDGVDLSNPAPDRHDCRALYVRDMPFTMPRLLRIHLRTFLIDTLPLVNIAYIGRSVVELLFRDHYSDEAVARLQTAGFVVQSQDDFDPCAPPDFANTSLEAKSASQSAFKSRICSLIDRPGLSSRARLFYQGIAQRKGFIEAPPSDPVEVEPTVNDESDAPMDDCDVNVTNDSRKRNRIDEPSPEY